MTEQFLQYIWKNTLYASENLTTIDGASVEVISPGIQSFDAGPDFIQAKIKIDDTLWAGNVEIHLSSSDWFKHNHHKDKSYDSVILHVVYKHDKPVVRSNGTYIPVLELEFEKYILEQYTYLQVSPHKVACEEFLPSVNRFFIDNWLDNLIVERLNLKATEIKIMYENNHKDLNETFYQLLVRNFGFKTNKQPMDQLSRSLPFKYLQKQRDSLPQLEAFFLGQAGFLEDLASDEYSEKLQSEWRFLKNKYKLEPMEKHLWKFLRLRPANFPTVRLMQLAAIFYSQTDLLSTLLETNDNETLAKLFVVKPSDYWKTHYTLGKISKIKNKTIGDQAFQNIKINTIAPWLFFYGQLKSKQSFIDRSVNLLENTPAEKNSIINYWTKNDVKPLQAAQSQALLQLNNEYCRPRGCLYCHIGNQILTRKSSN